jgi:hypothetical protein
MTLSIKETVLIDSLLNFYKSRIEIFRDIVYQNTSLSLRLIDWLVTNYSKKYNIIYPLTKNNSNVLYFNIYLDYKNQLKAYSKKFFDPFCRQKRIIINSNSFEWTEFPDDREIDKNFEIITTVGQMNFFKWFIQNKIFMYALSNLHLIDNDMVNTYLNKKKGKREVLSEFAVKGIYTNNKNVIIKFES